ncbi:MAG: hypothetical protein ACYC1M_09765 [Armatimonadota bacterium]
MNSHLYALAGFLLLPIALVIAAKQSYHNAASEEDRRYYTENWRTGINSLLHSIIAMYTATLLLVQIDFAQKGYDIFRLHPVVLLLALVGIVVLTICYRSMAKMKRGLMPETEYSRHETRVKLINAVVWAIYIMSSLAVTALCILFSDSIDDSILWMLVFVGMLVAICGPLFVILNRYATRLIGSSLPTSEMEMLKAKLAEADRLLNQHLPEGHIPVKLELMEFMIGYADSMQRVCVEMISEKRVSVSLLGLKRLDEHELQFLSLSGAFTGLSNKSQIAADQRALAITEDRHTAISALKKELATAFKEVRFLQKRIKALEMI